VSPAAAPPGARRGAGFALDAMLGLAIVSLIHTPYVAHLAGAVFANEFFFHWDHFAMGPALAFRHGMALATDVYSQYGAGWPLLLNAISPWFPLSHQTAVGLAMLYGCVYHVGLYVLLRVAVGSRALAFGGTLGILAVSVFSPLIAAQPGLSTIWQWPSLSVMRAPMDVWFFLCLFLHARNPTFARAVAAGAVAGAGLLLETDTGVFLVGTFLVYGVCRFVAAECGGSLPRATAPALPTVAASVAALCAVLFCGLAVSSRGTLVTEPAAFFSGWIGGVANSSARGVGANYFTFFLREHGAAVAPALALLAIALFAVCDTMVRLLQGRAAPTTVLSGCLGLYALGRATLFVWRTVPIRLSLMAVPIGILVVLALASLLRKIDRRGLAPALSALAAALGAGLLLASPTFRDYPNAWRVARVGPPERGLVLFPEKGEIAGLPTSMQPVVRSVRAVVAEVRALAAPVAVLDPIKTLVYVEADEAPWRGDASLFLNTWTHAERDALTESLARNGPPHVIFRSVPSSPAVEDTWRALGRTLEQRYVRVNSLGVFERWDRKPD